MFIFGLLGLVACLRCSANERLSFPDFQGVDSAANWLARKGSMILPDPAADPHVHTLNGIAGAKFRQVRERFDWVTGQSSRVDLAPVVRLQELIRLRAMRQAFMGTPVVRLKSVASVL